jgi:hypothetical protein
MDDHLERQLQRALNSAAEEVRIEGRLTDLESRIRSQTRRRGTWKLPPHRSAHLVHAKQGVRAGTKLTDGRAPFADEERRRCIGTG